MEDNVHEKHRSRVFEKYDADGLSSFKYDYEVLEVLLFYAIPRKNTNPVAHRLIDEFGSLNAVLKAPRERLAKVKGVGPATARYFALWREALERAETGETPEKLTPETADKYFKNLFKNKIREEFYMICLDPRDTILACEKLSEGTFESTEVDQSKAARLALKYDSAKVVFAHNHPSGICEASGADLIVTGGLDDALRLVGVSVRDHVIVTNEKTKSIMLEYMEYRKKNIKKGIRGGKR